MENQSQDQSVPEVEIVEPAAPVEKAKKVTQTRWFWPIILVAAGLFLLARNLNLINVHLNWWAGFIFIPVVGSLAGALGAFQKSKRFDAAVRNALGSAIVVGTVATMFLFDVSWHHFWPLMLIAPAISMLLNGISIADVEKHPSMARWFGLGLWFGLATLLLGCGFLAKSLPIPALEGLLIPHWWAIPIVIPGVGAFVNALIICAQNGFKPNWTVTAFCVIGVVFTATGLFAYFNLNWNLLSPIILIGAGLVVLSGMLIKK